MNKFQFFVPADSHLRSEFTYLEMTNETFLDEKQQLLNQGLEVDGEPILAKDAQAAVESYRFGFANTVEEYSKSIPSYAVSHAAIEVFRCLFRRKR